MKNNSLVQAASNQKIRENRLKMRHNLKLNLAEHENKIKATETPATDSIPQIKTETHIKLLNLVGLVQKQYIQGVFEDAYELKEKIGEGAHATVYKCIQKSSGNVFAVKVTKQGDEQLVEASKVQFKILKNLIHDNVMKAEAFYTDRVKLTTYLVCQYCDYPELRIYLGNRNKKILDQAQATTIIQSLLQTLQYLHKKGICHRDIKPENILYNPQTKQIKLIDFDCSKKKRQIDTKFQMWTKTGSIHYQAPECFQSPIYNEKVDIWAAGIIAYELVTGSLPFKSHYYNRMVKMIVENEIDFQNMNVSEDFKKMLKKLLQKDPIKRYSASQCLRMAVNLKTLPHHCTVINDDFNVILNEAPANQAESCTQISIRSSETTTCGRDSPLPLLKFFCFVAQL